jgi:hypothetical protein
VLAAVCEDYAAALDHAGFAASDRPYGWGGSADGLEMTGRIRRLYWSAVVAAERGNTPEPPDPFDTARPDAFTAWLNEPDGRGPRRWSRFLRAVYEARPDVQAYAPDLDGAGAARFDDWLRACGVVQERIPPCLEPLAPCAVSRDDLLHDRTESPSPPGLNVAGYFQAELGVGEAARLLTRAIAATGAACVTATRHAPLSRQQHGFEALRAAAGAPFDMNLLCMNADVTPAFARDAGADFFANRHTIGYWFWEVDPLPAVMHGAFDYVDEVWTATEYVAGIVRAAAAGRTPVFTVPLPLLAPPTFSSLTREQLGLPADRFVFLFVFDFLSVMERKNPLGAIEAFCAAFAPGEGPVLVLKSINGEACVSPLERLRRAAAHRPDILIRDGYVGAGEKNALLASCDCYVSLHRAEGLGLTLAEAMALGKPAIATGYSGNRHFMTAENSFLVEYRLTSASGDCGPYPPGARWAEPDLAHAARLMRAVYQHPGEAKRRAERGRADLLFNHGVLSSATAISDRLATIRGARDAAAAAADAAAVAAAAAAAAEAEALIDATTAAMETPPADPQPEPAVSSPSIPWEVAATADAAVRGAALEAFVAALPQLQKLGKPRLSRDHRSWPRLRRIAQRAMFRLIRPYWFQQRQFQRALLEAVRASFERLAASDPVACDSPRAAPPRAERGD